MKLNKIKPKFIEKYNPRVGLIALATDFIIERDFIKVIKDKEIDFFVNRIDCYNPLSKENLIKMSEKVTEVTNNILPKEDIDCIVYGCTSGTIAAGYDSIKKKVKAAKPNAKLTASRYRSSVGPLTPKRCQTNPRGRREQFRKI